jgi:glutathione S-transferase
MIKLYQFPSAWGLAGSLSPPCMKFETWLRITGIPYEVAPFPSPTPSPKGKWPYIDDNGTLIGDSTLIVEHLRRTRGRDPDEGLTPVERAISLAFRRMLKENLFWVIIQIRHRDEANFQIYRPILLSLLAPGVPPDQVGEDVHAAVDAIRANTLSQMYGHGMARHTAEEVHQIGIADLFALSDFLGDKPFFFGDRPTGLDATAYAYLAHIIDLPLDSPSTQVARGRQNLVAYCRRMRARFFPEAA